MYALWLCLAKSPPSLDFINNGRRDEMSSCSLISESSLREALVDVLLPLAPDDLRMLGVPRLNRAHERFWLAVKWERKRVSIRDRRKKEMDAPPNSIPGVVLKVHRDLLARLRVNGLAECVVREKVRDDRVQELCREVHPRAITAGNQNHAQMKEN